MMDSARNCRTILFLFDPRDFFIPASRCLLIVQTIAKFMKLKQARMRMINPTIEKIMTSNIETHHTSFSEKENYTNVFLSKK